MPFITRLRRAAALALAVTLFAAGPALAQQAQSASSLSPDQRKAVEALVREYLIKNPEIIQEALLELDRRNQTAQLDAQKQAVKAEQAAVFDAPNQIVVGNPKGDVTLVEFFDYNCGYCKRSLTDLQAMVKADPKLKVILKDFPILGPESVEASRVAVAVKNQLKDQKYWDFHVALMGEKGRVNGAKALEVAKASGVDIKRLQIDMDSNETKTAIQDIVALGDRLSLTGTPAFIIGDEVVFGAVGEEALKGKIAAVRQCGKASC